MSSIGNNYSISLGDFNPFGKWEVWESGFETGIYRIDNDGQKKLVREVGPAFYNKKRDLVLGPARILDTLYKQPYLNDSKSLIRKKCAACVAATPLQVSAAL